MEQLNFFNLLSYGAIGLSCILSVLAYRLLTQEQKRDTPNPDMHRSIRQYMAFALVVALIGTGAELFRQPRAARDDDPLVIRLGGENNQLRTDVERLTEDKKKADLNYQVAARDWAREKGDLETRLSEKASALSAADARCREEADKGKQLRTNLEQVRKAITDFVDLKTNELGRLSELPIADDSIKTLVRDAVKRMREFDEKIRTHLVN